MAKAKKLPSGSWRCQVFSHYEPMIDKSGKPIIDARTGQQKHKRIYKSFTCDDPSPKGKKKAEAMATAWALEKEDFIKQYQKNVGQMLDDYIESKRSILSPTTISGYKSNRKNLFTRIEHLKAENVNNSDVQHWLNQLSASKSPKTIRNAYGLLTAAYDMYFPSKVFSVKLPQKQQKRVYTPSDFDIETVLDYFSDDPEMVKAIYLAAYGTLRRSEICALTADDVIGNMIHVNKACVRVSKDEWKIKETKTASSTRYVPLPKFVIDTFPKSGPLVNLKNPDIVSGRFIKAMKHLDLPHFRFHDLRHYSASIMHALGIPDQYIMAWGGWSTDRTLKDIYRGTIEDYERKYADVAIGHFESMQHEMQHKKEKSR